MTTAAADSLPPRNATTPRRKPVRLGLDLCERVDALIQVIVARLAREPTGDPTHDPIEDHQHVGAGGHPMAREREPVLVIGEHAVEHEKVEVHVEVDQAPRTAART